MSPPSRRRRAMPSLQRRIPTSSTSRALGLDALHHVLRAHLDYVPPRPVLSRIAETSGGNPLYAIEIARMLRDAPESGAPGAPLPLPRSLLQPRSTTGSSNSRVERGERCSSWPSLPRRRSGFSTARPAGAPMRPSLLPRRPELSSSRARRCVSLIRFSPVCAQSLASASDLRAAHRALARAATDPEQQARHLALSSVEPAEDVAQALEDAATMAQQRGATDAAAELATLAVERTPPARSMEGERRALLCGECLILAGDTPEGTRCPWPSRRRCRGHRNPGSGDAPRGATSRILSGNSVEASRDRGAGACCSRRAHAPGCRADRARVSVHKARLRAGARARRERARLSRDHDSDRRTSSRPGPRCDDRSQPQPRSPARQADRMARALALPADVSEPRVSDRLQYHLGNILLVLRRDLARPGSSRRCTCRRPRRGR